MSHDDSTQGVRVIGGVGDDEFGAQTFYEEDRPGRVAG